MCLTDVLDGAKDALSKCVPSAAPSTEAAWLADIAKDKSVINFAPIEDAVNPLKTMGSFWAKDQKKKTQRERLTRFTAL